MAQAQLKAVELLLPRYAWRQNVTNATGIGDTSGFFGGGSEPASIAFDIEIFNEAGLSYRLFTPAFECRDGSVSLADPSVLRSFSLSFPEDQRVAFINREQPRLQNGVHRLEYQISVTTETLAPDQIIFIELLFSEISIDHRISAPIQSVLARYGAEDSLDFLSAEERFIFTYLPEVEDAINLDEECGYSYQTRIDALREELRSSRIWEYVPVLDGYGPLGIPF